MRAILIGVFLAACVSTAHASDYDVCVLAHMQGVSSDVAADAIKQSCLRTTEEPLPDAAIQTLNASTTSYFGALPFSGNSEAALFLSMHNTSGYTLTELVIYVQDNDTKASNDYVVRDFAPIPPPNALYPIGSTPPSTHPTLPPGLDQFYFQITETAPPEEWSKRFTWGILAAKGFSG